MKITIQIQTTPGETSSHLRRNLLFLFNRLGFIPKIVKGEGTTEWTTVIAEGIAPNEVMVEAALPRLLPHPLTTL